MAKVAVVPTPDIVVLNANSKSKFSAPGGTPMAMEAVADQIEPAVNETIRITARSFAVIAIGFAVNPVVQISQRR